MAPVPQIGLRLIEMTLLLVLFIVIVPVPAYAYVDPGILAVLYQVVYVFIFGTLVAWLLRPWRYLKGLFSRPRGKESESAVPERDEARDEDVGSR